MTEGLWTAKDVAQRLEEAAATLSRLPLVRVRGYRSTWPPIVRDVCEAVEPDRVRLGPPSPAAIDRMDEALQWLHWLEPDEMRLVWLRAEGVRWKVIAARFAASRSSVWRRWTCALIKVAEFLNRPSRKELPYDRRRQMKQDLV